MILALDLGTSCGWCLRNSDGVFASGTWDLSVKRFEGKGMRFIRFVKYLNELRDEYYVKMIAYEEVRRHLGTTAAHIYGGFQSHLQVWADEKDIELTAYPVATIKKKATKKGNANKEAMLSAAQDEWPELDIESYDEADALWIGVLAAEEYPEMALNERKSMAKEPEEQLDLIDVGTVHGKKIVKTVKEFVAARNTCKEAKIKKDNIKDKLVGFIRESDLEPIDIEGTIKVTVDGFTITVSPQEDSLAVKETTTGEEE